ncbi:MAG TPA: LysM peptidoglycan-binding domain-containing protein [Thermoanaerobaculia bacterium]|nr:LysM peptidoglycan-binding domain-containing protein [Thermoanaerobaculia bacterium]
MLLLAACLGCAGKPQPNVKIRYSDIQPEQPVSTAAVPAVATLPPAAPQAPAAEPAQIDSSLPALGILSTREAMEKAVSWAVEGLTFYQKGQWEPARKNFNDARLILLEADLPDFWKAQGLVAIQSGLPDNLRHFDLEAVARELERTDRLDANELAERTAIETEVRRILRQFGDNSPNQAYLNVVVHETQHYIQFYRGKYRGFFERSFLRKHKYWPTIQEILAVNKLPGELGYIAFVESGFNPKAVSRSNAQGLWQFIPETGRRYGLVQRDDFHDVRMSTQAAAGYLKDLLSIFGSPSFLLATASYNAGEGRIMGCLRQLDNPFEKRSFWDIRSCLPFETQEYVPKIMAAAVISSDPKRFGFYLPTEEEMRQRYDVVVVPQVTSLVRISQLAGIDLVDLRLANNDLDPNFSYTPGRNFPLYLPAGAGAQVHAALTTPPAPGVMFASTSIPELGMEGAAEPERRPAERRTYTVKGGDTLSSIARQHDLDVQALAKSNGIRSPYTLSIGQRVVLPGDASRSGVVYTVKTGNSLTEVASLFSVRDDEILSWNELRSRSLKSGQRLTIFPSRAYEIRTYKVRRGDSLAAIARRFGVSIDELLIANGLSTRKILRPGQRLVVYVPA